VKHQEAGSRTQTPIKTDLGIVARGSALIGIVEQTVTILRRGVYSVVTFSNIGLLLGHRFERMTAPRHGRVNPK
jgi:hypothetical protein